MERRLLLGVDIGTTNVKAMLVTPEGEVAALASEDISTLYPAYNQIEQDADEILTHLSEAVRRAAAAEGVCPSEIVGMAIDSNRCGLILADDGFRPLTNNMTWQDFRSSDQVAEFARRHPELDLYRISGEEGLPQHSLFKALWCRENLPEIWRACRHIFLSPKDYVLYRLLGRHVTSKSIAQSTGLFDINTLDYSEPVLRAAGIDRALLPELCDSDAVVGELDARTAAGLGLRAGLPVVCGLCDATASQLGTGAIHEGLFTISVGTCGAIRTYSPKPVYAADRFDQVRTFPPFGYVPSCTVSDAGNILKWFCSNFCEAQRLQAARQGTDVYRLIDEEAAAVPAGSEGLLLLPYFTGASYAVKDAAVFGVFAGIRNFHTHAHFSRAVMEGVAYSLRAVLDSFRENGLAPREIRLGGGGAKSPFWGGVMADVLDIPIRLPACTEASALGSAIMASVGIGIHGSLEEAVDAMVRFTGEHRPDPVNRDVYDNGYILFRELFSGLRGFYRRHADLVGDTARSIGK